MKGIVFSISCGCIVAHLSGCILHHLKCREENQLDASEWFIACSLGMEPRHHTQAICHVKLKILDDEISTSIRGCVLYITTLTAYKFLG